MALAGEHGRKARFLAGGTDLLIDMKLLRVEAECLIDLTDISELRGIVFDGKELKIGAATPIRAVVSHPLVMDRYAALFEATSEMATTQIRNVATIGGNLCTASPGAEIAPPLLALGARIEITCESKVKSLPLDEFFVGPKESILGIGEILTAIFLPVPVDGAGSAYIRISRTHSDLRQINAAAALVAQNGVCEDVRIALGAVAPTPVRARNSEDRLRGRLLSRNRILEAANLVVADISPRTSIRSTSHYREHVAPVLVKRVLERALQRAQGI
jgi:carbon-monoxide dehydrogenase medium subunit